jgi:hypothetical protein
MDQKPKCEAAEEIEITPEMIEAGAEVIWQPLPDVFAYDSASARWLAEAVFRAMADAAHS